jgi:prevent-host-death family protein
MARRSWSMRDARNHFGQMVKAARHRPQTVTKHKQPAVVVLAAEEYERLSQLARMKAPSFTQLLLAIPADGGEFERLEGRLRECRF